MEETAICSLTDIDTNIKYDTMNTIKILDFKINKEHKETVATWKKVALRACYSNFNSWEDFDLKKIKTRRAIRHKYNPKTHKWIKSKIELKLEDEAFDSGAQRLCYRLKKIPANFDRRGLTNEIYSSQAGEATEAIDERWKNASNYIAKCYKAPTSISTYFKDVQLQMDAKMWAEEYNRHKPPKSIDIIQMTLIELIGETVCEGENIFYHMERFIEGDYVKYNSNTGFVRDENIRMTPQAFSHFTFERSGHALIVVDIQGVGDLWTDPQIHTANETEYNDGNLGIRGMSLFFHSHLCNDICESLQLSKFDLSPPEKFMRKCVLKSISCKDYGTKVRGDEVLAVNGNKSPPPNLINIARNIDSTPASSFNDENSNDDLEVYFHEARMNSRSSCIENEINLLLIKTPPLDQFVDGANILHSSSILGKIHLDLCRCHENGRFLKERYLFPKEAKESILQLSSTQYESALFHLQLSAKCDLPEANISLAKLYLHLPRDILADFDPFEGLNEGERQQLGLKYMEKAAQLADRSAMIYLAQHYETCSKELTDDDIKYKNLEKSMYWLERAINEEEGGHSDISDIVSIEQPLYILYAKMGYHLKQLSPQSSIKNIEKAASCFEKAAKLAMKSLKGDLANRYYIEAEKCETTKNNQ